MAPFFTRTPHDVHETRRGEALDSDPIDRHGNLVNKKVKAVCKTCNNGWMSKAEMAAKEPLIRLMHRLAHTFSADDQDALARWIMIKLFVMEWDKPASPAFTQETRDAFYNGGRYREGKLPENLFIDLLAYEGGGIWTAAFHRQAIWIGDEGGAPTPDSEGFVLRNTQSVTFGIGYLTVHVFHSYTIAAAPTGNRAITRRIWPPHDGCHSWPPFQIMTSDEIKTLSIAFSTYLASKGGLLPIL